MVKLNKSENRIRDDDRPKHPTIYAIDNKTYASQQIYRSNGSDFFQ